MDPIMVAKQIEDEGFQPDPEWIVAFFMVNEITLYIPFKNTEEVRSVMVDLDKNLVRKASSLLIINSAEPTPSVIELNQFICATALKHKEWLEGQEGI